MGEDEALQAIEQMQRDLNAMSERLEQLKKRRP
jgi:ABC-type Fe3+-hydroxamate transport system substrate-binding protein